MPSEIIPEADCHHLLLGCLFSAAGEEGGKFYGITDESCRICVLSYSTYPLSRVDTHAAMLLTGWR